MNELEWNIFLHRNPLLALGMHEAMMNVVAPQIDYFDTAHPATAVVTRDGKIGLWIKLDREGAAMWNQNLKYATAGVAELDPWEGDWSDEEIMQHMIALDQQQLGIDFLLIRAQSWLKSLRTAMFSLGWDVDLLDGPREELS